MSRWQRVLLDGGLGPHAARWDALNQSLTAGHPLLASRFVDGLLRHFGSGREYLFWCERDGRTLAMCILQRQSGAVWSSFLPSQSQIGPTLVGDYALLEGIWRALPPTVLQLDLLCNDPHFGAVCAGAAPNSERMNHALTIHVALQGSFEAYLQARPRKLQQNLKRYQKRVAAAGEAPRHVVVAEPQALLAAVARYAELEGQGWKGELGTALNAGGQLAFYQEVLAKAAAVGEAQVHELWFGERLAASRLLLRQGAMWVFLKTTYDAGLASFSPGRLLLLELLRHAFQHWQGMRLEFYTDADQNLLGWATHQRWIAHLSQPRNAAVEVLLAGYRAWGGARRQARALCNGRYAVAVASSVAELPDDARRLLEHAELSNGEAGCGWYGNLVDTVFSGPGQVRFYILRHDGEPLAVLPLYAERQGLGWQLRALGNYYTSLYQPAFVPCLKPHDLLVLLAAVRRDYPGAATLTLRPMDPGEHAYQTLLGALRLLGWLPFEYFAFGNWYQPVTSGWDSYLAARPGELRSTLKRMGKKFSAAGGTLEIVSGGERVAEAIAAYQAVYARSWKRPEPYPEFLPGLVRLCAAQGSLRLGLAWLDGRAIAAQLWIVRNGHAAIYKLAYDEAARAFAPGSLLSAFLMQHVIEVDRVQEIDYLQGDDPYKQQWMSERRERWGIVAYQPRTLVGMLALLRDEAGRITRRLRRGGWKVWRPQPHPG